MAPSRPWGRGGEGDGTVYFCDKAEATTTCLSSPVNGTKTGRTLVENFSPNQTRFTLQRTDPISRYRFFLRARTQVGEGEAIVEESPALLNEGRCSSKSSWLCWGGGAGYGGGVMVHASAENYRSGNQVVHRTARTRW